MTEPVEPARPISRRWTGHTPGTGLLLGPLVAGSIMVLLITGNLMAAETPKSLGYTFPDEWEVHRGTMMIFPAEHHYGREAKGLRQEFAAIARAIAMHEPVEVFCLGNDEAACRKLLGEVPRLTIHPGDYSIDWARDNAPMVLRGPEGRLASAGFRTNGWLGRG